MTRFCRNSYLFKTSVAIISFALVICFGAIINLDFSHQRYQKVTTGFADRYGLIKKSKAHDLHVQHYKKRLSTSDTGYILATHYSDQLTGSSANLFSLQCWANTLKANVRVVEPFIHYGSLLGVSLDPSPNKVNNTVLFTGHNNSDVKMTDEENTIKLGDIFDKNEWGNLSEIYFVSSLVSWEHFLEHAPRNLILVDRACDNNTMRCMQCQNGFSQSIIFHNNAVNFAKLNGFKIVRKVCYRLIVYNNSLFKEEVYGNYNPNSTVVIFNHWGGVHTEDFDYRIPIEMTEENGDMCNRGHYFFLIQNSKRINKESKHYVDKFIKKPYLSVMIRMEHLAINNGISQLTSVKEQSEIMSECIQVIVSEIKITLRRTNLTSIFLSTDSGKYGSIYMRKNSDFTMDNGVLDNSLSLLYSQLFGDSVSMSEHMKRIEEIASFTSPGYIAMLQREIAANGACMVLGGGGVFQEMTSQLHKRYNAGQQLCQIRIENCSFF